MDISATSAILNIASTQATSATSQAVNVSVLKKALNLQATNAATLLQSLPQPALASSGSLGTQVNTFA